MVPKMEQREESDSRAPSDFSIDHILNRAGGERGQDEVRGVGGGGGGGFGGGGVCGSFDWLRCTRFCPPRVPRTTRKDAAPTKRQLGRYPRIPFTEHQLAALEEKFQQSAYLSGDEAAALSRRLCLADAKVKIWFQNRRARKRREEAGVGNRREGVGREGGGAATTEGASASGVGFVGWPALPFVYLGAPSGVADFDAR